MNAYSDIVKMGSIIKQSDATVSPLVSIFPWIRDDRRHRDKTRPRRYAPRPDRADPRISDSSFPPTSYPNRSNPTKRGERSGEDADRGVVEIDFYI